MNNTNTNIMTGQFTPNIEKEAYGMMQNTFSLPVDKELQAKMEISALISNMPAAFLERGVEEFKGVPSSPEADSFFNELNTRLEFINDLDPNQVEMLADQALHTVERKFVETNIGVGLTTLEDGEKVALPITTFKREGKNIIMKLIGGWENDGTNWLPKELIPNRMLHDTVLNRSGRTSGTTDSTPTPSKKPRRGWGGTFAVITTAVILGAALLLSKAKPSAAVASSDQDSSGNNANSGEYNPGIAPVNPVNQEPAIVLTPVNTKIVATATQTDLSPTLTEEAPKVMDMPPEVWKVIYECRAAVKANDKAYGYEIKQFLPENNPDVFKQIYLLLDLAKKGQNVDFAQCFPGRNVLLYDPNGLPTDGLQLDGSSKFDGSVTFARPSGGAKLTVSQLLKSAIFSQKWMSDLAVSAVTITNDPMHTNPEKLKGGTNEFGETVDPIPTDPGITSIDSLTLPSRFKMMLIVHGGQYFDQAVNGIFSPGEKVIHKDNKLDLESTVIVKTSSFKKE